MINITLIAILAMLSRSAELTHKTTSITLKNNSQHFTYHHRWKTRHFWHTIYLNLNVILWWIKFITLVVVYFGFKTLQCLYVGLKISQRVWNVGARTQRGVQRAETWVRPPPAPAAARVPLLREETCRDVPWTPQVNIGRDCFVT